MTEIYGSFSGCGTIFMVESGAMQALLESGFKFKGGAGTSGGSIVWGSYAAGLNPETLLKEMKKLDFKKFEDRSLNPWDGVGLLEGKEIYKMMKEFMDVPFGELKFPTQVVTTDLDKMEEVIFNSAKDVDICTADIIRASMAIQGLFKEHVVAGRSLSDGGVFRNTPIDLLPDLTNTIGVKVGGGTFDPSPYKVSLKNPALEWLLQIPLKNINNMIQKGVRVINSLMEANEKEHIEDAKFAQMLILSTDRNGMSFDHSRADIDKMFRDGYNQTKEWLKKKYILSK